MWVEEEEEEEEGEGRKTYLSFCGRATGIRVREPRVVIVGSEIRLRRLVGSREEDGTASVRPLPYPTKGNGAAAPLILIIPVPCLSRRPFPSSLQLQPLPAKKKLLLVCRTWCTVLQHDEILFFFLSFFACRQAQAFGPLTVLIQVLVAVVVALLFYGGSYFCACVLKLKVFFLLLNISQIIRRCLKFETNQHPARRNKVSCT